MNRLREIENVINVINQTDERVKWNVKDVEGNSSEAEIKSLSVVKVKNRLENSEIRFKQQQRKAKIEKVENFARSAEKKK